MTPLFQILSISYAPSLCLFHWFQTLLVQPRNKGKAEFGVFSIATTYLRLIPKIIFSHTTFVCSIIFQPRSRYLCILQEDYSFVVVLVYSQSSFTPCSNLQRNMSLMQVTIVLVCRHHVHNLPMFLTHFFPCLGTSFSQHPYIFPKLLSLTFTNLQTSLIHSWFKFNTFLANLLLCICLFLDPKLHNFPAYYVYSLHALSTSYTHSPFTTRIP